MTDTMYLDNIKEWLEEYSSVTYKWVSNTLSVPADLAKQMLFQYSEKNTNLQILYLLSGIDLNGVYIIQIIPQEKLEKTKKELSRINSLHIYSLQNKIPDTSTVLYTLDQESILKMEEKSPYSNSYITNQYSAIEFKEGTETVRSCVDAAAIVEESKKETLRQKVVEDLKEEELRQEKKKLKRKANEPVEKTTANKLLIKKKSSKNLKEKPEQKGNLTNFFTTITKESKNSKGYMVFEDVKEEIKIKEETKIEEKVKTEERSPDISDYISFEPPPGLKVVDDLFESKSSKKKKKTKSKTSSTTKQLQPPPPTEPNNTNTTKQGQITSFFKVTKPKS